MDRVEYESEVDERGLKPLNEEIQICPVCYKVEAYKDDGHDCAHYQRKMLEAEL